jgi:putative membrane protein
MKQIVWLFKWLLKAAIFFTLFAFALNNQGDATVQFFFGYRWTAPMVLIVLGAFAAGLVIGVMGMVPRWWRHRRDALVARQVAKVAQGALSTDIDKQTPVPRPDGL